MSGLSHKELFFSHKEDLLKYFALTVLSRSKSADSTLARSASDLLFSIRTNIEKSILNSIILAHSSDPVKEIVSVGDIFGASLKQGISLRMPILSCIPTGPCSKKCYAHDALDAAPNSVIRGAINGWISDCYENGSTKDREYISRLINKYVENAVKRSQHEVENLDNGWSRNPRIRFSHVGEIAAYPDFSNELARMIKQLSDGRIVCVVYTRHPNVKKLDPSLWVINFTIDHSSKDRIDWIPPKAHMVYSAFDGEIDCSAYVNYLEHHRWSHCSQKGNGIVCPATLPGKIVRSCDALRCDRCFV